MNNVLQEILGEINTPNRGTCDYFIVDRIEAIIKREMGNPDEELKQQKTDKYIEAIWEREKRLEQYAKEIKDYCENVACGNCRDCYFGKPPEEGQLYPSWNCKFNSDNPGDWEV